MTRDENISVGTTNGRSVLNFKEFQQKCFVSQLWLTKPERKQLRHQFSSNSLTLLNRNTVCKIREPMTFILAPLCQLQLDLSSYVKQLSRNMSRGTIPFGESSTGHTASARTSQHCPKVKKQVIKVFARTKNKNKVKITSEMQVTPFTFQF